MTVHAVHTMYQLPGSRMVFVVVQIRSLCKVIKPWYGCVVPDQVMLVDLYHQYASGQLDSSTEVSAELV